MVKHRRARRRRHPINMNLVCPSFCLISRLRSEATSSLDTRARDVIGGEDSAVVADGRPHSLSFLFPGRKRFGESTVAP